MARKKYTEVEREMMKRIAINLKGILTRKGVSQKDLCDYTGLATSTISDYVNANTLISPGNLQIIADALNVMKSEIDGSAGELPAESDVIKLPVVGRIACGGLGSLAYEDIEGFETTPRSWIGGGEFFYLRAKGDSMNGARIYEGDLLLIRKQPEVEDGEIAVVLIEDEAVLKRVYRSGDSIILQSENPKYHPIVCSGELVRVIGKLKKIVIDL
jgi:repressor LexA